MSITAAVNPSAAQMPDLSRAPTVDQVGIEERVERLQKRSIKKASKVFALKLAMSMIDMTTLEGADSPGKVRQLCVKAKHMHDAMPGVPHVAAVCIYPTMVRYARPELEGSGVKIAAVATGFPSGQYPLSAKLDDTKFAVDEGADEIDMVISRGHMLAGDFAYVFDEIATIKEACRHAHLKVILETGELGTFDTIRKASDIAMHAGADFIKTSTGKIQPGATPQVTLVMLEAIRDFYYATGKKIGMKPAGGIANAKTALQYLVMLRETLGQDWLTPDLYRIGASRLANDILMQLAKEQTGVYQSIDYFSKD
jgi:deoxyribose-phosphate aldolase